MSDKGKKKEVAKAADVRLPVRPKDPNSKSWPVYFDGLLQIAAIRNFSKSTYRLNRVPEDVANDLAILESVMNSLVKYQNDYRNKELQPKFNNWVEKIQSRQINTTEDLQEHLQSLLKIVQQPEKLYEIPLKFQRTIQHETGILRDALDDIKNSYTGSYIPENETYASSASSIPSSLPGFPPSYPVRNNASTRADRISIIDEILMQGGIISSLVGNIKITVDSLLSSEIDPEWFVQGMKDLQEAQVALNILKSKNFISEAEYKRRLVQNLEEIDKLKLLKTATDSESQAGFTEGLRVPVIGDVNPVMHSGVSQIAREREAEARKIINDLRDKLPDFLSKVYALRILHPNMGSESELFKAEVDKLMSLLEPIKTLGSKYPDLTSDQKSEFKEFQRENFETFEKQVNELLTMPIEDLKKELIQMNVMTDYLEILTLGWTIRQGIEAVAHGIEALTTPSLKKTTEKRSKITEEEIIKQSMVGENSRALFDNDIQELLTPNPNIELIKGRFVEREEKATTLKNLCSGNLEDPTRAEELRQKVKFFKVNPKNLSNSQLCAIIESRLYNETLNTWKPWYEQDEDVRLLRYLGKLANRARQKALGWDYDPVITWKIHENSEMRTLLTQFQDSTYQNIVTSDEKDSVSMPTGHFIAYLKGEYPKEFNPLSDELREDEIIEAFQGLKTVYKKPKDFTLVSKKLALRNRRTNEIDFMGIDILGKQLPKTISNQSALEEYQQQSPEIQLALWLEAFPAWDANEEDYTIAQSHFENRELKPMLGSTSAAERLSPELQELLYPSPIGQLPLGEFGFNVTDTQKAKFHNLCTGSMFPNETVPEELRNWAKQLGAYRDGMNKAQLCDWIDTRLNSKTSNSLKKWYNQDEDVRVLRYLYFLNKEVAAQHQSWIYVPQIITQVRVTMNDDEGDKIAITYMDDSGNADVHQVKTVMNGEIYPGPAANLFARLEGRFPLSVVHIQNEEEEEEPPTDYDRVTWSEKPKLPPMNYYKPRKIEILSKKLVLAMRGRDQCIAKGNDISGKTIGLVDTNSDNFREYNNSRPALKLLLWFRSYPAWNATENDYQEATDLQVKILAKSADTFSCE